MTSIVSMNSRNKGHKFEREVVNLIKDNLGIDAKRNLMQTAEGGFDVLGVPRWAIECKRYKQAKRSDLIKFWEQTYSQALRVGCWPALIVKEDRQPIDVYISWLGPAKDAYHEEDFTGVARISFDLWCCIVREQL
jgi:hypothetical protein